ncbi:MAG TPA: FliH/SctL family protein [Solirubrobacteraceae bacterium]|nr:FliH/SctL family protein [Solirubrobacteraceae bacterium]
MSSARAAASYAFEQLGEPEPLDPQGPFELLAKARVQAEQMREQARREGYEQGLIEGRAEGLVDAARAGQALSTALRGVLDLPAQLAPALERDAVELALALSERVFGGALQVRRELLLEPLRGALRTIGERHHVTVAVNPGELEVVREALEDLRAQAGIELCELHSDPSVEPGGAVVRGEQGEVDASVATQLQRAGEALRAELSAAGA